MSDHLLKTHLKIMLSVPGIMIFVIVYSTLYHVYSPAVCKVTGQAPTEEFLFSKVYEVVFPEANFSKIAVRYEGWFFARRVFVSDGSVTIELDDDIEYGSFFNRNSNYLMGRGYYELFFREPDLRNYSVTLDACGLPQDDSQWLEVLIDDAKDLKE